MRIIKIAGFVAHSREEIYCYPLAGIWLTVALKADGFLPPTSVASTDDRHCLLGHRAAYSSAASSEGSSRIVNPPSCSFQSPFLSRSRTRSFWVIDDVDSFSP